MQVPMFTGLILLLVYLLVSVKKLKDAIRIYYFTFLSIVISSACIQCVDDPINKVLVESTLKL